MAAFLNPTHNTPNQAGYLPAIDQREIAGDIVSYQRVQENFRKVVSPLKTRGEKSHFSFAKVVTLQKTCLLTGMSIFETLSDKLSIEMPAPCRCPRLSVDSK